LDFNQKSGKPLKMGLNLSKLKEDLTNLGFSLHENLGTSDIKQRYFHEHPDEYFAKGYEYIACAVVEQR
jgi:hypothetical protein